MKNILVVGAGFAGATYARELAERGWHVDVIDRRPHIAGNAYDEVDHTGVCRHVYGPHLFHTNNARVVAWLRRFTTFVPYDHRVSALVCATGEFVPFPINRTTINAVFGVRLTTEADVRRFLSRLSVANPAPRNAAEYLEAEVGVVLTNLFFRAYTEKMWGRPLEELDAAVVKRVPIRFDDESRYFPNDLYQGIPGDGYTKLVGRILDHPFIHVSTSVPFSRDLLSDYSFCFTSMAIDEFFDFRHGMLPYRSILFHHRDEPSGYHLGDTAQVNYTDDSVYTRETDWSRLPGHVIHHTGLKTVTREEPCDPKDNAMERYYPVKTTSGTEATLYDNYKLLADKEPTVAFIGRCGTYQYLNMDQVINQSLVGVKAWLKTVSTR